MFASFLFYHITNYCTYMTYSIDIKFTKGDKRITYTKEHVITEIVSGINGYKDPIWEIISIEKIDNSIEERNITST